MKEVELRLRGLTCEFDDGEDFDVTGQFTATTYGDVTEQTEVIFAFPNGPIRLHKGLNVPLDYAVRVTMHTLEDMPGSSAMFLKFGW